MNKTFDELASDYDSFRAEAVNKLPNPETYPHAEILIPIVFVEPLKPLIVSRGEMPNTTTTATVHSFRFYKTFILNYPVWVHKT
jgi:hypothetical protein